MANEITKAESLRNTWNLKRETILKKIESKFWGPDAAVFFREIREFGDSQAALERENLKQWLIKKLEK